MDNNNLTPEEKEELQRRIDERHRRSVEQREKSAARRSKIKKAGKHSLVVFKSLLAVVVVLSILFVAAKALGNMTFSGGINYISDKISGLKPGEGYPLDLGSADIINIGQADGALVVLTDDSVKFLNSTAKTLFEEQHSFSAPTMQISGGRVLVSDATTGRYMLLSTGGIIYQGQIDERVFASAVSKTGSFALASSTKSASSSLIVFGDDGNKKFEFKCADEYIIGVSISPDGKKLAAIAVGSKDTELYSKLYIIDIKKQETISDFTYNGTSLTGVKFTENETVIVIGTNTYNVIKNCKEQGEINDFGYNSIVRSAETDSGKTALVFSKFGSVSSYTAALLDSKGKELFSTSFEVPVEMISCDGRTVSVFTGDNKIISFNLDGKQLSETAFNDKCQQLAVIGKYNYVLSFGKIYSYSVK